MRAEVQHSIVQNKFREWFEDPAPVDIPLPEDAEDPIQSSVPDDRLHVAEAKPLHHKIRKKR